MRLSDSTKISAALDKLTAWSRLLVETAGAEGAYLFGSLVYRGGEQFIDESDVDLAIVLPLATADATSRLRWNVRLHALKIQLEDELARVLGRRDRRDIICSIVALTSREAGADIHKDGAEGFFTNNHFMSLLDRSITPALPGAGRIPVRDRLIRQCFRFAQRTRNRYLAVSSDGTMSLLEYNGSDPIPKDVMRHAAMAAWLQNTNAAPGSEYDTQAGLDLISNYIYQRSGESPEYGDFHRKISARRGARGRLLPITAKDILLMAEIIWDLAESALQKSFKLAQQARHSVNHYLEDSISFFAERFGGAFPGIRGIFRST